MHPFTIVTTVKVKGKAPIEYTRIVYAKTAMEALLQKAPDADGLHGNCSLTDRKAT